MDVEKTTEEMFAAAVRELARLDKLPSIPYAASEEFPGVTDIKAAVHERYAHVQDPERGPRTWAEYQWLRNQRAFDMSRTLALRNHLSADLQREELAALRTSESQLRELLEARERQISELLQVIAEVKAECWVQHADGTRRAVSSAERKEGRPMPQDISFVVGSSAPYVTR